jgi:hypothetical protein
MGRILNAQSCGSLPLADNNKIELVVEVDVIKANASITSVSTRLPSVVRPLASMASRSAW